MPQFSFLRVTCFAVLLLLLAAVSPASGQCPDPYCPGAELSWGAPQTITGVSLNALGSGCGSSCYAKVIVRFRNACGVCDVFIDSIVFQNPTLCSCPPNSGAVIKIAIDAALRVATAPPGCEPQQNQCIQTFRAMIGGCWRTLWSAGHPPSGPEEYSIPIGYVPCAPSECCYATYEVCKDGNNNKTYTLISEGEFGGECETEDCFEACGFFPSVPINGSKRAIGTSPRIVQSAIVTPNPTSGTTSFTCASENAAEATLEIHDIRGRVLLQHQGKVSDDGLFRFTIDVKDLPSGTYRYRINNVDEPIATGLFTVAR